MTDRELLYWLSGYLKINGSLTGRQMELIVTKIGDHLGGDEKIVYDTKPFVQAHDGNNFFESTTSDVYNAQWTMYPDGRLVWEELDSEGNPVKQDSVEEGEESIPLLPESDHVSYVQRNGIPVVTLNRKKWTPLKDPLTGEVSKWLCPKYMDVEGYDDSASYETIVRDKDITMVEQRSFIESLDGTVRELHKKIADLECHNKWLLTTKDGNVSEIIGDNVTLLDKINDLDQTVIRQNDKIIELGAKNDNLANVICEQNETIAKRDQAVKELKFKLKMYTREIEQLEEIIGDDTKEIQRLQSILYERDIDF